VACAVLVTTNVLARTTIATINRILAILSTGHAS